MKNIRVRKIGAKVKKYRLRRKKFAPIKKIYGRKNIYEFNRVRYFFKIIIVFILIIAIIIKIYILNKNIKNNNYGLSFKQKMSDYLTKKFAVFGRRECPYCGIFCFFIVHLGCVNKYVSEGYIPIIDMQNYDSIYNRGDRNLKNPWELFFYQPNGYTLEEVKKYAKNIDYVKCHTDFYKPSEKFIYYQNDSMKFWHDIQQKYIPIRNEIINQVENNKKKFFGGSKNILGVLIRGTDYVSRKPKYHCIPPTVEQVIVDVKEMDQKYKYDYIYFTSEDEEIRKKFIPEFKDKVKYLNPKYSLNYINNNITDIKEQLKEFHNFVRIYIINMVMISKCLDVVISRCHGAAGVFVLTEGFRNTKIYDLGIY